MNLPTLRLPARSRGRDDEQVGIDPTPDRPRPNVATIGIVAAAVVAAALLWNLGGGAARADVAALNSELAAQQDVLNGVETRLAAARDASRDERMNLLTVAATQLDTLVPPATAANSIEPFEINLSTQLDMYGLSAAELSRSPQLVQGDSGGRYVAIRVAFSGPRDGLFNWLASLHDHDRLATIHNLQFSFDRNDPSRVAGQAQLRLWYVDEPSLEQRERDVLAGSDTEGTDEPADDGDPTDDGFILEPAS